MVLLTKNGGAGQGKGGQRGLNSLSKIIFSRFCDFFFLRFIFFEIFSYLRDSSPGRGMMGWVRMEDEHLHTQEDG